MPETLSLSAAFIIGLLGSTHCIGMCGGIMGALTYAVPAEQRTTAKLLPLLLCYNVGRILSYTAAGAVIGATSWILADQFPTLGTGLRIIAGLMLVAMGLYLASWWSGLRHLEKAGNRIWKHIQPKFAHLMTVSTPGRAVLVGGLWGWIPCGLIYSTLVWAATAGDWQQSAMIMLFFGLGTLPAVLATGVFLDSIKKLLQYKGIRAGAGLLIILFGLWTIPFPGAHNHGDHSDHSTHEQMDHSEHMDHSDHMDHMEHSAPSAMSEEATPHIDHSHHNHAEHMDMQAETSHSTAPEDQPDTGENNNASHQHGTHHH